MSQADSDESFPHEDSHSLPLVPPRVSRSAAFCNVRATFEVKINTSETFSLAIFFILEISMNDECASSYARPDNVFGFHRIYENYMAIREREIISQTHLCFDSDLHLRD